MPLIIRTFEPADTEAVVALWEACGLVVPWNDPRLDIERKLQVNPELFLVGLSDDDVVASVMAGYEGHRGWINYLAVHPQCQKAGQGRAMMQAAEQLLHDRGCPKINLQVRSSNQDVIVFYQSIGYAMDDVVGLGKRLQVDDT